MLGDRLRSHMVYTGSSQFSNLKFVYPYTVVMPKLQVLFPTTRQGIVSMGTSHRSRGQETMEDQE